MNTCQTVCEAAECLLGHTCSPTVGPIWPTLGFSSIWLISFNTCNHKNWILISNCVFFLIYNKVRQSQSMGDGYILCRCYCTLASLSLCTLIDFCSPPNWFPSIKGIAWTGGGGAGGRGHKSGFRDVLLAFNMCTHTHTHTHLRICLLKYVDWTFIWACRRLVVLQCICLWKPVNTQWFIPALSSFTFPLCVLSTLVCTDLIFFFQKTLMMKRSCCRPVEDSEPLPLLFACEAKYLLFDTLETTIQIIWCILELCVNFTGALRWILLSLDGSMLGFSPLFQWLC